MWNITQILEEISNITKEEVQKYIAEMKNNKVLKENGIMVGHQRRRRAIKGHNSII